MRTQEILLLRKNLVILETKKKNNVVPLRKPALRKPEVPLKKQSWLKYVSFVGFLLLVLLVYYRKTIIFYLFQGEVTSIEFNLLNQAHAQEETSAKKKSFLDSSINYEKISFRPSIGLDGLNVASSFEVDEIACSDLNNDIYQLGILLYPPEVLNEKFLIKLRDCVVKLPTDHPLKKWLMWIGQGQSYKKKELEQQTFLTEILSSQFNLITDMKVKQKIINILSEIPESTLVEQILKSYLYLMIGNITRSDNILKNITRTPPRIIWQKSEEKITIFHRVASSQMEQILLKLNRHPADRKTFEIFITYLKSYFNQPSLITILDKFETSNSAQKIDLKSTEAIAPSFIHYLRLSSFSMTRRVKNLQDFEKYPLSEQSQWMWPFMDIDPLISEKLAPELARVEKEDQLWFIYLMDNERLSDVYAKKSGKSFLPARRAFLKEQMSFHSDYMMALYKLIEIGDINQDLIHKTTEHLIR